MDAKNTIDSLYQVVLAGADFAEIAIANSDDKGSAVKGGDLGWFGKGDMVLPFELVAFDLIPGNVSEPVKTQFGYHLLWITDRY